MYEYISLTEISWTTQWCKENMHVYVGIKSYAVHWNGIISTNHLIFWNLTDFDMKYSTLDVQIHDFMKLNAIQWIYPTKVCKIEWNVSNKM